jgi:hypothetical protein
MKEILIITALIAVFRFIEGRLNKLVEKAKTTANTWDDWLFGILHAVVKGIVGVLSFKNLKKK